MFAEHSQRPPIIILAGGESRRFGSPKGLFSFEKKFWIDHQLGTLIEYGFSRCVTVLGPDADLYFSHSSYLGDKHPFVSGILNRNYYWGQFSSIQMGLGYLRELGKLDHGALILPVDVPVPSTGTLDKIMSQVTEGVKVVSPLFFAKGGHPIWVSKEFATELMEVSVESHEARLDLQVRKLNPMEVVRVPVDDSKILLNLNHRRDMETYLYSNESQSILLQ